MRKSIARGKCSFEDRLERLWIEDKEPMERGRFPVRMVGRQLMKLVSPGEERMVGFKVEGRQLALTWRRKLNFLKVRFEERSRLRNVKV